MSPYLFLDWECTSHGGSRGRRVRAGQSYRTKLKPAPGARRGSVQPVGDVIQSIFLQRDEWFYFGYDVCVSFLPGCLHYNHSPGRRTGMSIQIQTAAGFLWTWCQTNEKSGPWQDGFAETVSPRSNRSGLFVFFFLIYAPLRSCRGQQGPSLTPRHRIWYNYVNNSLNTVASFEDHSLSSRV